MAQNDFRGMRGVPWPEQRESTVAPWPKTEQSSSELVGKALGSSVFDGKSSGSKRGPLRTHLGGYRGSGRSRERRATQTADGSFPEHFGDLRRVAQSMNSRGVRLSGIAITLRGSARGLQLPESNGTRQWWRRLVSVFSGKIRN